MQLQLQPGAPGREPIRTAKEKKPAPPHIAERVPVSAGKARRVKITRA